MGSSGDIIETGVDKLVTLVNKTGRIAAADAGKELGVGSDVIMEWADFLEEEGIISIEYKFTKPYLVDRKMTKTELNKKSKEFSQKKEGFIRKAEVSLSFLDREAGKLTKVKEEFDKIKDELGFDVTHIKEELAQLEKFEHEKIDIDKQIQDQKHNSLGKVREMVDEFHKEQKKFEGILTQIKAEEQELERERKEAASLEETEKLIKDKLNDVKTLIKKAQFEVENEEQRIFVSEKKIERLKDMAENLKASVSLEKKSFEPLLAKTEQQTTKIEQLQTDILKKIADKTDKLSKSSAASKKIKTLFDQKMKFLSQVDKINADKNSLSRELNDLISKARGFQLSAAKGDVKVEVKALEKKFSDVEKKMKGFEEELRSVSTQFKGK